VVVTDEGADDRLQLLTVNTTTGVTVIKDQATPGNGRAPLNMRDDHGSTDGQAFGGLFYAPNGPSWHNNVNWQRVCLSFAVGVGGVLTLDGSVTRHVPPDPNKPKDMWDPDAPLVSSGPMARVHFLGLIPGVGTSGSTGLIGVANQLDGISQSYTNFSVVSGVVSARYVNNGDGTVTDTKTGLMWEKKVAGSGCLHCVNDTRTWTDAMSAFISEVNGFAPCDGTGCPGPQAGLAGHTDWRLPTIAQLRTILLPLPCSTSPCIDPTFGPTAPSVYWSSSSTSALNPSNAWFVSFNGGEVDFGLQSLTNFVRAGRGGP
jgi:hypothetical protein